MKKKVRSKKNKKVSFGEPVKKSVSNDELLKVLTEVKNMVENVQKSLDDLVEDEDKPQLPEDVPWESRNELPSQGTIHDGDIEHIRIDWNNPDKNQLAKIIGNKKRLHSEAFKGEDEEPIRKKRKMYNQNEDPIVKKLPNGEITTTSKPTNSIIAKIIQDGSKNVNGPPSNYFAGNNYRNDYEPPRERRSYYNNNYQSREHGRSNWRGYGGNKYGGYPKRDYVQNDYYKRDY